MTWYLGKLISMIVDSGKFKVNPDSEVYMRYIVQNLKFYEKNKNPFVNFTLLEWLLFPVKTIVEFIDDFPNESSELGHVGSTTVGGNRVLTLVVKMIAKNGYPYMVFNCRTISHELAHLYFEILRPILKIKFQNGELMVSEMHRFLHDVDVYGYDPNYFEPVNILNHRLVMIDAYKIMDVVKQKNRLDFPR